MAKGIMVVIPFKVSFPICKVGKHMTPHRIPELRIPIIVSPV